MDIIKKIRELEKQERKLKRKHTSRLKKYEKAEVELTAAEAELNKVVGTLTKIRSLVGDVFGEPSAPSPSVPNKSGETLKSQIVTFLSENPKSTYSKVEKALGASAANYLSLLYMKDVVKREQRREGGPYHYWISKEAK